MVEAEDPLDPFRRMLNEKDELMFLKNEGIEMLALFRSIESEKSRRLIVELARALAGPLPPPTEDRSELDF